MADAAVEWCSGGDAAGWDVECLERLWLAGYERGYEDGAEAGKAVERLWLWQAVSECVSSGVSSDEEEEQAGSDERDE